MKIFQEEIQGFGIPDRAATVREQAVTDRLDIMINDQDAAHLLTRAALIASASGSPHPSHPIHQQSRLAVPLEDI